MRRGEVERENEEEKGAEEEITADVGSCSGGGDFGRSKNRTEGSRNTVAAAAVLLLSEMLKKSWMKP
uniref:Uncharacterized protein n=1 Tax=Nelumbo nucifera TaxID=4432 RepID=A0A822ZR15_NELNU|nr:TPA_asm: hypothetical protein HUJ06_002488 [Nelumbo nucifera]